MMLRPMVWRVLALVVFAAAAAPLHATEVYQVSTISSLLAGGYDGDQPSASCSGTAISGSGPSTASMGR